jgi:hypothetical protein
VAVLACWRRGRRALAVSDDPEPDPLDPLVVGDYLLEGGENSWLHVIRLNRGDDDGLVAVDPKVVLTVPGFDDALLSVLHDSNVSIEGSLAFRDGVTYFANSAGSCRDGTSRASFRVGARSCGRSRSPSAAPRGRAARGPHPRSTARCSTSPRTTAT